MNKKNTSKNSVSPLAKDKTGKNPGADAVKEPVESSEEMKKGGKRVHRASSQKSPEPERPPVPDRCFPVVGIGASAGGLEALVELLKNMPANSGMAFVVVTHQHPGHLSLLPSLLGKNTTMPVI
jgi:two-component system, chemotaxis family, CheB/CheR fusion protein